MARVVAIVAIALAAGAPALGACELRTSGLLDSGSGIDASTGHDAAATSPGNDAASGGGGDDSLDASTDASAAIDGEAADADAGSPTGALTITVVQNSPSRVDLSALGPIDWVHWGRQDATSVDRKADDAGVIGDFVPIGTNSVSQVTDDITSFAWEDGAPTSDESGTTTAVYVEGVNAGFAVDVAAGTAMRTLTLYVGGWRSDGSLLAQLSDQSAPDQTVTPPSDHGNNWYSTVTIAFRATHAAQTLTLKWTCTGDFAGVFNTGNVTLRAAAVE